MDLVAEPGWTLQRRGPCGLFRRRLETDIGRYVDNGRRMPSPSGRQLLGACLTQSLSLPQPTPKHVRRSAGSEKDVKIVGTNSISRVESIKVSKKRTQNEL
jgi:hypothetical protein